MAEIALKADSAADLQALLSGFVPAGAYATILAALARQGARLDEIAARQADLLKLEGAEMLNLDDLLTEVKAESGIAESVRKMVDGLRGQIADALKDTNASPETQAKMQEVLDAMHANADKLTAAVQANAAPAADVPATVTDSAAPAPAADAVAPAADAAPAAAPVASVPPVAFGGPDGSALV